MSNKYYITTPIYYVNDKPHIGHAYTSVATDFIARFMNLKGYDVRFQTGTDEHGLKIQKAAEAKKIDPIELCNQNSKIFRDLTVSLNLSNDDFIRTTEKRHASAVTNLWNILEKKEEIYLSKYSGWYSIRDEAFYAENEIIDGKAPSGSKVEWVEESSYFFKLSEWGDKLLDFYNKNPEFVKPNSRFNEVVSFVEQGLKDLSISRTSFDWGIKVPGNENHVIYVWIDALTNYLTALGYPDVKSERYLNYWPANYHIVGKDILRFHAIYWPALLMAANLPLPNQIIAHGWWTVEKEKMSKSMGNVIDPNEMISKYGLDQFRFFLLREVPFGNDGDFSISSLVSRVNSDLANSFGNLVNRVFSMTNKNLDGLIPDAEITDKEKILIETCDEKISDYMVFFKNVEISKALESVSDIVSSTNKYIDDMKPWSLAKEGKLNDLKIVLKASLEMIRIISILFYPVMPDSSEKILNALNIFLDSDKSSFTGENQIAPLAVNKKIGELNLLFPKIDKIEG